MVYCSERIRHVERLARTRRSIILSLVKNLDNPFWRDFNIFIYMLWIKLFMNNVFFLFYSKLSSSSLSESGSDWVIVLALGSRSLRSLSLSRYQPRFRLTRQFKRAKMLASDMVCVRVREEGGGRQPNPADRQTDRHPTRRVPQHHKWQAQRFLRVTPSLSYWESIRLD